MEFETRKISSWKLCLTLLASATFSSLTADAGPGSPPNDCDEVLVWSERTPGLDISLKCEYSLGDLFSDLPAGEFVTQVLPELPPQRLTFRIWIDVNGLVAAAGEEIRIFELRQGFQPGAAVVAGLSLVGQPEGKPSVALDWQDDGGSGRADSAALVNPGGATLELEWARSFDANGDNEADPNGTLRLLLDGLLIAQVEDLLHALLLPREASFGVLSVTGAPSGTYAFKPLDFRSRYFPNGGPAGESSARKAAP